ncbi:hypothetical protein ABIE27_002354 [Paenibacillus sp. 4624]
MPDRSAYDLAAKSDPISVRAASSSNGYRICE